jgi:hypothetical protein
MMAKALDAKTVQLQPAGHFSQEWQVRLPPEVSFHDIFEPRIWAEVEKIMRSRGNKHPRQHDLLRVIGHGFDVICLVTTVSDGYGLEFYAGKRPSPVAQVLDDLTALPDTVSSTELKERASVLRKRWAAAGISREHLNSARRVYAKTAHPDTNAVDGQRLAAANAILDAALATMQEVA